jgi:hypothetical protein
VPAAASRWATSTSTIQVAQRKSINLRYLQLGGVGVGELGLLVTPRNVLFSLRIADETSSHSMTNKHNNAKIKSLHAMSSTSELLQQLQCNAYAYVIYKL